MNSEKTILIVEDNLDAREIYSEILRDENFNVITTEHGPEALEYLEHASSLPDLIVMDLTFPLMTAKEFVAHLQAKREWQDIPLMVVSGQVDTKKQSEDLHAKGFMKKPFAMDPFVETIRDLSH